MKMQCSREQNEGAVRQESQVRFALSERQRVNVCRTGERRSASSTPPPVAGKRHAAGRCCKEVGDCSWFTGDKLYGHTLFFRSFGSASGRRFVASHLSSQLSWMSRGRIPLNPPITDGSRTAATACVY